MRLARLTLLVTTLAAPTLAAQSETLLFASDGFTGQMFGFDVSLSGSGLLVGAPASIVSGPGSAYVFRSLPGGWVEEATLEAPGATGLGSAVALLGDLAFVGDDAYQATSGHTSGAVFLFERSGGVWGAPTLLLPSDAATSVGFGHSLAVQPGRLLVGGTRNAYVFEPVAGVWTETAILAGGPEPLNGVDLSGERAVLAHARAFVFEHDGSGATGWNSGTVLDDSGAATPPSGTGSIRAVALDEDRVAVMNHPHICLPGELHGYEYLPGEWRKSTISYFTGSNYAPAAMDGGRLAVSNGVELFIVRALPSGGWVEEETLTSTIPGANVPGGVDIEGHLAVHGVPFDSVAGSLLGAVRIWELSPFAGLPEAVSVLSGGKQELELRRGPDEAFALYWIFGSATGTSPGLVVDGLPFPLNFDAYYQFLALNPNTLVNPTIGILDGHGHAPSHIEFPPIDPTLVGVTLHHAYLTIELSGQPFVDFTSNAVPLRFATESDLSPQDFEATVDGWDFGPAGADWQIVEDGQCGAVSRMAAYTSAAPNCGGDLTSPIANARLTSAPFRLGQVGDYELHLKSILTPGLQGRIRLFVNGAESAYFEVAWPYDFAGTGALESLSFRVPGSEAAIGDEAYFEFVLNGTPSGSPAGWWVDDVELVKLP